MKRRRRGNSEEEPEELARARRERARKARADLAAKAKGEGDSGKDSEAESKPAAKSESEREGDRAKTRERLTRSADALKEEDGKTDRDVKRKDSGEKDGERKGSHKPKSGVARKSDEGGRRGLRRGKPLAGGRDSKDSKASREPKDSKDSKDSKDAKRKRGDRAGSGAKKAGKGTLVALKQGATETRARAKTAAPKVAAGALGLLATAFGVFFTGLGIVLSFLGAAYRKVAPPVRGVLRVVRRAIEAVSRQVTPIRVLALVVAGAAILLALSQFADYRNISIGNDAYADGIQTVAPAPVRETAETGSAHSYLMVPLAGLALLVLGAALTGRWRLCRLIAVAGVIAIVVGLVHDRPTGLDVGEQDLAYTGVKATLLGGFYAQLFAGLLLTLSSLLLGRELRLAGARRPARASRGSRARRKLLRRNPRVEGARA